MNKRIFKWGAMVALAALSAICFAVAFSTGLTPMPVISAANPEHLGLIGIGGMIVNVSNLKIMFTGFKTIFQKAFDGAKSDWQRIAMKVPSKTSQEVYAWLGQTTRFREWIGDRVIQNLKKHDFTIKNKSWENTFGVDKDAIEDDSYGVFTPSVQQLGQDAREHPDELIFGLLAKGFSERCYDGQYFFDTDHPVVQADGSIGSVSNFGGGSGAAWFLLDASKMIKPIIFQERKDYSFLALTDATDENVAMRKEFIYGVDARNNVGFGLWQLAFGSKQDLTEESYAAARQALMSMKGDNGKPLGVRPTLLVVPPSLEGKALKILTAENNANGETNIYRNTAELLTTPWLA